MDAVSDDRGKVSHARLIALFVGVSATAFMWKLTITGQLTTEYFVAYLAYGVIHQSLNKSLETLRAFFTRGSSGG